MLAQKEIREIKETPGQKAIRGPLALSALLVQMEKTEKMAKIVRSLGRQEPLEIRALPDQLDRSVETAKNLHLIAL
jgi:hypothetical protein